MTSQSIYDAAGVLIRSIVYDLDAGTVTVTDAGQSPVTSVADPDIIADMVAAVAGDVRRTRLATASATLRQWAADARATNVGPMTVAQHKAVTQTVIDRLGTFFDRFADLLDER